MYLPNNEQMLLSVINTALRDRYSSLSALCDEEDVCEQDITAKLNSIGYYYNQQLNAFICKKD